jgi:hypothetical protein
MIESIDQRTGTNPATGTALSTIAGGNPINGNEWTITDRADLQYACIFPLPEPIDSTSDCVEPGDKPLCEGNMQVAAKAYPGRRQLAVLKAIGPQAIVASICPSNLDPDDLDAPDWGYRPAIAAIVDHLRSGLVGMCWDLKLVPDENGSARDICTFVEAVKRQPDPDGEIRCPPCTGIRSPVPPAMLARLPTDPDFVESGANCTCAIREAGSREDGTQDLSVLHECISTYDVSPDVEGWCYLDSDNPEANSELLASCPTNGKRLVRFVGRDIPTIGSLVFRGCK